jgi:hypothetical protein
MLPDTPKYKCGPGFGTRGETAYNMRARQGLSWDEIAEALEPPSLHVEGGNPASAVSNAAKKYANAHGLDWPIVLPPAPKKAKPEASSAASAVYAQQESAYTLRASGLPWAEAAERAGYKHTSHAVTGASKHAARNGLAWPIVLP